MASLNDPYRDSAYDALHRTQQQRWDREDAESFWADPCWSTPVPGEPEVTDEAA